MNHTVFRWFLLTVATLASAGGTQAADAPLTSVVRFANIDIEHTKLLVDGQATLASPEMLRTLFGLPGAPKQLQALPRNTNSKWELVVAFREPVAVGTQLLLMSVDRNVPTASVLRTDFKGDITAAMAADWVAVEPSHVFAPGTRIRALRLAGAGAGPDAQNLRILMLAPRLVSVTSEAVGSGEKAPFGSHPNAIPNSRTWVNAAADPNPNSAKQVQRAPISEVLPSWYILSWDTARTLRGVWLSSNAERFTLSLYRGDPKLNPAVAGPLDWEKLPIEGPVEVSGEMVDRFIPLPSVSLTALKVEITATRKGGPVAEIRRFDALTDLGDRPLQARTGPSQFVIPYQQPFDGSVAMVITDAAGRPIRNLVAQVDRKKGPAQELWDLKDEAGQTVPPGEYRWKAITAPPIGLEYQFAASPNVAQHNAKRVPWLTDESGPDGWMADHSAHSSGVAWGERVFFGAPVAESGVSLIECDLDGKKLWAKHGFGPFVGVTKLAADRGAVYVLANDALHRLEPAEHTLKAIGKASRDGRGGQVVGMTAASDKLYLAMHSQVPYLDNALRASEVDLDHCLPLYPDKIPDVLGNRRVQPNPRQEFLRLLRLTGTPSGQGDPSANSRESLFPIDLETVGDAKAQFILVAFKSPVPLGSVLFPCPGANYKIEFSALKNGAAYPPDPRDEKAWQAFATQPKSGWACVAAPPQTRTRALRVKVTRTGDAAPDPFDDLLEAKPTGPKGTPNLDPTTKKSPINVAPGKDWFLRIEGMRMLRRRFEPLAADAAVRVNSGAVDKSGVWDAKRTTPVTSESPGVYLMEWKAPQKVTGLAIKEIDGAETEIDVWEGPAGDAIPLGDSEHWKKVATYVQSRRDAYQPSFARNESARYLDGTVDFGREITTRAIRLRVVRQWADNNDRGTATQRRDRGGQTLDPRRCAIYGVLALRHLGEEPEVDRQAYQRIEVRDGRTGNLIRELPTAIDGDLTVNADGILYGLQAGRVVRIDSTTGATTPLLPTIDGTKVSAGRLAAGPDGNLFVFEWPEKVIKVYRPTGELVRTIGKPGGQKPGPWDPEKFLSVNALIPDARGGLWVVESQDVPRRIVQYGPDGKLVREHLGNSHYGGGGVLDRFDKNRLFFANVEFELDWKTGKSRIKNLLAENMPEDLVPIQHRGLTYLASTPLSYSATQPVGQVYLYDKASGTARLVAAFGESGQFGPLKAPAVLAKLAAGKVPSDYTFIWADRNGNSQVDPDEIEFQSKDGASALRLGRFNEAMQCRGGDRLYQVREVLANGTPVFAQSRSQAAGLFGLRDGKVLDMNVFAPGTRLRYTNGGGGGGHNETIVRGPDGAKIWAYPTEHQSVSGLWLPPWEAGYVSNEFGVVGHEVEERGELGEFFVTHANNGQLKIWTADGLLAGTILRHKFDPLAKQISSFPDAMRGTRLDGLSGGQEHFHGYFTKIDADGKYYIVHGHNLIGLFEVLGLDKIRRLTGTIKVTAADSQRVRDWEEEQARREVKSQARLVECLPHAGPATKDVAEIDGAKFAISFDADSLYLRWTVDGYGELKNTGTDFRRYFKTGAIVDVHLATDPAADPARRSPARGDLRLVISKIDGKPEAVLYQPVAPNATASERWETRTDAGGTTAFDRVVQLADAKITVRPRDSNGYTVQATVPLRTLGIKATPGTRLAFDWGVQTTDDGRSVKRRMYWSNRLANGTTDEAIESRLEPHLWGTLVIATKSSADNRLTDTLKGIDGDTKPKTDVDDLLKSLEKKKP
ncbi:MAG: hypothetical protein K8T89_03465 [Planctomycetes bacterium]|nr:hypothetical protein [Planctomycetota bacterium]